MRPWEKEVLHVRRGAEGQITDVFEGNPATYYKVVDTAITGDPNASDEPIEEEIEAQSSRFAKELHASKKEVV
jgi:hypothetical protein